jgi:hypothetical protein
VHTTRNPRYLVRSWLRVQQRSSFPPYSNAASLKIFAPHLKI